MSREWSTLAEADGWAVEQATDADLFRIEGTGWMVAFDGVTDDGPRWALKRRNVIMSKVHLDHTPEPVSAVLADIETGRLDARDRVAEEGSA